MSLMYKKDGGHACIFKAVLVRQFLSDMDYTVFAYFAMVYKVSCFHPMRVGVAITVLSSAPI